jgi:acid stress-induced BolA-like protein IbaG/YrbA
MHVDNWKYFDADDYVIVVNTFQEEEESESQQNVYVALKKDIEKNVSVHDVMVECLEMK